MALAGEGRVGAITNDVLKFRKVIEFESLCIVIFFSYIYLICNENQLTGFFYTMGSIGQ